MKTTINKMISKKRILSLAFALTLALGLLTCVTIWSGTAASSVSYLGNANKLYSIKFTVATGTDSYTVTFDANGHGTAPSSQTVTSGGKATEPTAPTADGYTFGGWYKESGCTNKWNFTSDTVTANTTLYAKWTAQVAQVGDAKYTSFSDALSAWNDGTTLTLLSDVTTSSMISVDSGTKTLDLNGHGINANSNCGVIKINSGASLTLNDSDTTTEHKYTISSPKSNGAGLAVVNDSSGSQTFNGGYITGGQTDYGGGILVDNGTLVMNGGTIIGNQATTSSSWNGGGAVLVRGTNGSFTMNGGALIGNTTQCGGAISVTDSSKLIIEGGEIKYNCSTYNGGAINSNGNSTTASITMSGGSITNNWTQGNDYGKGGGVLVSNAELALSGNPIIADNLCDTSTNNVYLAVEKSAASSVKINGKLGDNANIGVTMYSVGVFTNSTDTTYNDASKFKSDNTSYAVGKNTSGQLFLGYTVTFDKNGHGTAPDSQILESGSHVTEPTAPTETGYTFGGWYTEAACTTAWNFSSNTVTANTTLYAKWTKDITATAEDVTATYDGEAHGITVSVTDPSSGATIAYGTAEGTYDQSSSPTITDVSDSPLTVYYKVTADGYTDLTGSATVTINKRSVTLTSATDTKEYDGKALTNSEVTVGGDGFADGEGATYDVTGSQKVVGSSANSFSYTLNSGTDADNYSITANKGILTVTSRDAKYEIDPQAYSGSAVYDGYDHSVEGIETDTYEVDGLTYTLSGMEAYGSGRNAGEYAVNVTGTPVVVDADGNDVSSEFSVIPKAGTLTISKRSVTLTSASASKVYDGKALTKDEVTVSGDGFADGEGAAFTFTSSLTAVGESDNAFTYTLNSGTEASNYSIADPVYGRLTVTRADASCKAPAAKKLVYNKKAQKLVSAGTTKSGTLQYSLDGKSYSEKIPAGTDADKYTVYYRVKGDGNHNDLKEASITVTIEKAEVTLKDPVAKELKYTGKRQKLVTEGRTDDGVLEYSLDGESFDEAVPEAAEAGEYTVYYRVTGDENHKDSDVLSVKASILREEAEKLSDKAYGSLSGSEEFVLGAGDGSLAVSVQGCKGMDALFELQAVDGGFRLESTMDNYGRSAKFNISFDKEGGNVSADVSCGEYHSKYK